MSNEIYDIGIIGAGVAGTFALHRLNEIEKKLKVVVFEAGRPPMKRRHQIYGWLGCLPSGDGKLYMDDIDLSASVIGARNTKNSFKIVNNIINETGDFKTIKSKDPSSSFLKKINKLEYGIQKSDFIQMIPKDMHTLSKKIVQKIDSNKNIDYIFDEDVVSFNKEKKIFNVFTSDQQQFKCKKLLLSVGRGGWKWAHNIFSNFGIVQNNNVGKYGINIETDIQNLKELNGSSCHLVKEGKVTIGRFCWGGSVIPEDHGESAITAFRSNEKRWETDKVSFNLVADVEFNGDAVEQIDRISNLTFLLANDRVAKEKLSLILTKKSKISIMKEYNWVQTYLEDLEKMFPGLCEKSNFYYPTVIPMTSQINVYSNLETDIEDLYVAGETAGIKGILGAMISGVSAANSILK